MTCTRWSTSRTLPISEQGTIPASHVDPTESSIIIDLLEVSGLNIPSTWTWYTISSVAVSGLIVGAKYKCTMSTSYLDIPDNSNFELGLDVNATVKRIPVAYVAKPGGNHPSAVVIGHFTASATTHTFTRRWRGGATGSGRRAGMGNLIIELHRLP